MAIIIHGKTQCSICGLVINEDDPIVASTHFIDDQNDPLWPFSDSGMHKFCFKVWPLRRQFVERYNGTVGTQTWGNGTYHYMEEDGHILVLERGVETR